jgi:hypothetical protein
MTGGTYSEFKAFHVERNHYWVLFKDLPLSYLLLFPFFTAWRYSIQIYGLFSGKGSVARLAERTGPARMAVIALKSFRAAGAGLRKTLKKRRQIWGRRRLRNEEYRDLLGRHRITAKELMLRD